MSEATHAYVAKREGQPGAYAACVDMPDHAKDTAYFVKEVIKEGGIIERVSAREAGFLLQEWFRWKKSQPEKQGALL